MSISSATVAADISTTQAPAGATFTISWGDGNKSVTTDKDTPVPHTYTRVGSFSVELKVTAPDGDDETSLPITVTPVGGMLTASATNVVDGTPVTLTVTPPSQLGPGETVTAYIFNRTCEPSNSTSQGTVPATAPTISITQPVYCVGQVSTTVEAQLSDGGRFYLDGPVLTATAAPPVLSAVVTQTAPRTVQVDLTGSTVDGTVDSHAMFSIDWGDGNSIKNADLGAVGLHQLLPIHQYDSVGNKTITIWIGNDRGASATTTRSITVTEPAVSVPTVTATITPVAGTDRYATGILASQKAFPTPGSAGAVVLARGDQFADALTGIPLAAYRHAPLLVTPGGPSATLDPRVAAEIRRTLGPGTGKTVYVLGGTSALPQGIADYITNTLHYRVVRYAGIDRYATALTIAKDGLDNPDHIVAARGDDFADALTAGPLAADKLIDANGRPAAIVLTQGPAYQPTVDAATAAYIRSKESTTGAVTAVGHAAWNALSAPTFHGTGQITGYAGKDRYETAAIVAAAAWRTDTQKYPVGLATGTGFADALTGGALIADAGGPLLLTDPATLSPDTAAYLHYFRTSFATVDVFGGPTAITPTVINAIDQQLYSAH